MWLESLFHTKHQHCLPDGFAGAAGAVLALVADDLLAFVFLSAGSFRLPERGGISSYWPCHELTLMYLLLSALPIALSP